MAKNNIDETLESLEEIIVRMESGEVGLEETFKLYNDGLKLAKSCNSQIDKIEKQIEVLQNEDE